MGFFPGMAPVGIGNGSTELGTVSTGLNDRGHVHCMDNIYIVIYIYCIYIYILYIYISVYIYSYMMFCR